MIFLSLVRSPLSLVSLLQGDTLIRFCQQFASYVLSDERKLQWDQHFIDVAGSMLQVVPFWKIFIYLTHSKMNEF